MENIKLKNALWIPLFSARVPKLGLALVLGLIAILAVTLPADIPAHGIGKVIYYFFSSFSDVGFESQQSKYPFVSAITYGVALISAPLMMVLTCFTLLNLKPIYDLIRNRSLFGRFIMVFGLLLFLIAPYFLSLSVASPQFSTIFFNAMTNNRFLLLIWCNGIFLLHYVLWILVIFEFTEFYNFLTKGN